MTTRYLDLAVATEAQRQTAERRQVAVARFLDSTDRQKGFAAACAKEAGVGLTQFYELVRRYKDRPHASTLIPLKPGPDVGSRKGSAEAERLTDEAIREVYLGLPLATATHAVREARGRCLLANVKPLSKATIYRRIAQLDDADIVRGKQGSRIERQRFAPLRGRTPPQEYPLQRVQIDHTQFDCHVVDVIHRQPIGRPYLTLIIDEATRAILGHYLTLAPPCTESVARAITRAVLPKERYLYEIGLPHLLWPMRGIWRESYTDNAAEFVGDAVKFGCLENSMDAPLQRPPGLPNYGGYIERLMRTAMVEARILPGATGSRPKEAGPDYDAEAAAAMTLDELNRWLTHWIVTEYNTHYHSEIRSSPLAAWNRGMDGDGKRLGCGPPRLPKDERKFLLDFMPIVKRTVQPKKGVRAGNAYYWHELLLPYMRQGGGRTYTFKIDPGDIRTIYFFEEQSRQYVDIPARRLDAPPGTREEYQRSIDLQKAQGSTTIDEAQAFRDMKARQEMVRVAQAETAKSKKARRRREKDARAVQNSIRNTYTVPANDAEVEDDEPFVDDESLEAAFGMSSWKP